jgi:hypothetical protein
LEALDAQGTGDDDSLYVTVSDPDASFNSDFTQVDYRGDLNGWGLTPMSLTGDFTWTIEVYVNEENVNSQFKFYTSGRWYGTMKGMAKPIATKRSTSICPVNQASIGSPSLMPTGSTKSLNSRWQITRSTIKKVLV